MDKPSKLVLKEYNVETKDTVFAANARLLQSIWRINHITSDCGMLGNFLPLDTAKLSGTNFLTPAIFRIVQETIRENKDSLIKKPRIWDNMLSSQPLCFNLFGELSLDLQLSTALFNKLFPNRVEKVTCIKFEYAPKRGDNKFTGDKSAFDVFVEYDSKNRKKGFIGIEVKYAEPMNDEPSSHKTRYEDIYNQCGLFVQESLIELNKKPLQQIWRDHLLSISMYKTNPDYNEGLFIFLYPEENMKCAKAVASYKDKLKDKDEAVSGFCDMHMKNLVYNLKELSDAEWIVQFEKRYLDFDSLRNIT